jgi:GntR family transcriptional regulator
MRCFELICQSEYADPIDFGFTKFAMRRTESQLPSSASAHKALLRAAVGAEPASGLCLDAEGVGGLRLDASSSKPRYQQLMDRLKALIDTGALPQGEALPAERVLALQLGISRTVVKRAYGELRAMGVLDSNGRQGTQVSPSRGSEVASGRLKSFEQQMVEQGLAPSVRLVSRSIESNRRVATLFRRPASAPFLHVVLERLANALPMAREHVWYDLALVPELAEWDGLSPVRDFLRAHGGVALWKAEQSVEAAICAQTELALFGLTGPQACLLLRQRGYTEQRQMLEYVEGVYRSDAYAYRLQFRA